MRMYFRFIGAYIKSLMEYRFLFLMDMGLQIVTYALDLLGIWILIDRFSGIMGWTFNELLFLYTFDLCSYALAGMFIKHPMLDMEEMVRTGSFDAILTKPLNPLFHVIARQFQHGFIGHTVMCIFTFGYCFQALHIAMTLGRALAFFVVLLGATLLQGAFMILSGSMSFYFIKSTSVVETAIYSLRSFLNYPITIYKKGIQILLTFIVPYAFVNFYPAELFLSPRPEYLFHPALQYLTPLVGAAMFALALFVWHRGTMRYESAGA